MRNTRGSMMALLFLVLLGEDAASADSVGVVAEVPAPVQAFGAHGLSRGAGSGSAGAAGESTAAFGPSHGVLARSASPQGFAAFFQSFGTGDLLRASANGSTVFSVSSAGVVTATLWEADGRELFQYGDLECAGCVSGAELSTSGVTAIDLAPGAVTTVKLVNGAVGAAEIAAGAVNAGHLPTNVITAAKLAEVVVTGADLAPASVRGENLFNGAIERPQIAEEAVTLTKINGVERPVYVLASGCREDARLTSRSWCTTRVCQTDPLRYWDCGSSDCGSHLTPQTCTLNILGWVLSPDTLP